MDTNNEDQQDVMRQIESIVAENKIKAGPDLFKVKAERKGFVLPLLVNGAALLLIVLGVIVLSNLFSARETTQAKESAAVQSVEGQLILALQKETAQNLAQKDQEIQDIQGQLLQVRGQRASLSQQMETKIKAKEDELRSRMQAELDAERQRLRQQGYAEEEVNRRMKILEAQKLAEFNRAMDDFKRSVQADNQRLTAELNRLEAEYTAQLDRANQERLRIINESKAKEDELKKQLEAAQNQSNAQLTSAQDEIKRLNAQRNQDQLMLNQINGLYSGIKELIRTKNWTQAQAQVATLKTWLASDAVSKSDVLRQRHDSDVFTADTLAAYIDAQSRAVDMTSYVKNAQTVQDIQDLATQANAAQLAGNLADADKLYNQLINKMPEISHAHSYLAEAGYKAASDNILKQLDDATKKLDENQKQITSLQADVKRLTDSVTAKDKNIADLSAERDRLKQNGGSSAQANSDLQKQITALTSDKAALQTESSALNDKIDALNVSLASAKSKNDDLASQLDAAKSDLKDSQDKAASLQALIDSGSGGANASDLAAAQEKVRSLTSKISDLQTQVSDLQTRNTQLQQTVTTNASQLATANSQLTQTKTSLTAATQRGDALERSLTDTTAQLTRTQATLADSERAKTQLQQLVSRLQPLADSYNAMIKRYQQFVADEAKLTGDTDTKVLSSNTQFFGFLADKEVAKAFAGIADKVKTYQIAIEAKGREGVYPNLAGFMEDLKSWRTAAEKKAYIKTVIAKAKTQEEKDFYQSVYDVF